jgi:hypothetical protein
VAEAVQNQQYQRFGGVGHEGAVIVVVKGEGYITKGARRGKGRGAGLTYRGVSPNFLNSTRSISVPHTV